MEAIYAIIIVIFLIVIYIFFIRTINRFIKQEKEIFEIYKLFIDDKKEIIEKNLYEKEKFYCYEFFKWEKVIKEQFNKDIELLINEGLTINSELYITLKEYEHWRNSQNRGCN